MSSAKYASITAGLLARKGEAQPWNHTGTLAGTPAAMPESESISLPWRTYTPEMETSGMGTPQTLAASPPLPPAREKSCAIRMSAHDYERLGILAVKSDSSRQQLLKDALAQFLAARARDYGCACLGNPGGACNSNCGDKG
jgi:hypothetical protein